MLRNYILAVFVMLLAAGCTNPPNANYNKEASTNFSAGVNNSGFIKQDPSLFKGIGYTKWQEDWNVRSYYYLTDGRFYFEFFSKREDMVLSCTMTYYAKNITPQDPDGLSFSEALNIVENKPRKVLTNDVAVRDVENSIFMKADKVYVNDDMVNGVKGATFYLPRVSTNKKPGVKVDFAVMSGLTGRGYRCLPYSSDYEYTKVNGRIDTSKRYRYEEGVRNTYYYNSANYEKVCSVIDKGVIIRREFVIPPKTWSLGIPKEEGYVDGMNCRNGDRVN